MKQLLIVGGGAAGLSAAVYAAERGAKVTVLEANPAVGGNGLCAEVMFGVNTDEQKKRGITGCINEYFNIAMENSHYKNNARLLRALINETGPDMDWLTEHGLDIVDVFCPLPEEPFAATHVVAGNHTGREVMKILRAYCETSDNVELKTKTKASKLILDENGAVTGVAAQTENGEAVFEADAVIIACGGYSGNPEMAKRIARLDTSNFNHLRGMLMDGSGISMAEEAGADIMCDGCFENAGPTFAGSASIMSLVTKRHAIWINASGRRFANEGMGDNFVYGCNAVYAQPGHMCYVLLDESMVDEALNGPVDFLAGPEAVAKGTKAVAEAIEKELKTGMVCASDNLEDIASWMGVDADILKDEIEEYNGFCKAGNDEIFLKNANLLREFKPGRYIAIKCGVDYILTHGGIRVDEDMHVIKADGKRIPNLYAAGVDISGVDANGYTVAMGGHSFGFSCAGGRIAARSAIK